MANADGGWVMQLKGDASRDITPACSASELQKAINVIGEFAVDWAVQMAYDNAVSLLENFPSFGSGPSELHMVRIGTEAIALRVLSGIATGVAPSDLNAEEQMIIRDFVARGVPLEAILGGLRRSHSFMMSRILAACGEYVPLDQQAQELQRAAGVLLAYVNGHSEKSTRTYHREQQRWQASSRAEIDELVQGLLLKDLSEITGDIRQIGGRLKYEIQDQWHIGVVAWQNSDQASPPECFLSAFEMWLRGCSGGDTLLLSKGNQLIWGWISFSSEPDGALQGPALQEEARFRTAVGTPALGIRGFRDTHHEAVRAREIAELSSSVTGDHVLYDDVRLLALLLADRRLAVDFARRELGGLYSTNERAQEIRQTVKAYLDTHSPQTVARELFIARNTVGYRLKQAEELLGRELTEKQAELRVAIVIADSLLTDAP